MYIFENIATGKVIHRCNVPPTGMDNYTRQPTLTLGHNLCKVVNVDDSGSDTIVYVRVEDNDCPHFKS